MVLALPLRNPQPLGVAAPGAVTTTLMDMERSEQNKNVPIFNGHKNDLKIDWDPMPIGMGQNGVPNRAGIGSGSFGTRGKEKFDWDKLTRRPKNNERAL